MKASHPGWRPSRPAKLVLIALLLGAAVPPTTGAAPGAGPDGREAPIGSAVAGIVATSGDNLLDRPIVDVASLPADADGRARLLVVVPAGGPGERDRVEILVDAPGGWQVADRRELRSVEPGPLGARLVAVPGDGEAFVLVLGQPDGSRARLMALDIEDDGIHLGTARSLTMGVRGAGAADVDGDGVAELLLETGPAASDPAESVCGRLEIRDLATLATRRSEPLGRLAGAGLADVDPSPGVELLAVVGDCTQDSWALEVRRPADASTLARIPLDSTSDPLVGPLVTSVPGPAGASSAVVLVADGPRTVVLDPAKGWSREGLVDGPSRPVGVADGSVRTVALVAMTDGDVVEGLGLVELGRDPVEGRLVIDDPVPVPRTDANLDRWHGVRPDPVSAGRWPVARAIDVDGDGCPDLIGPLVSVPCAGSTTGPDQRIGPSWVATRPLLVTEGRVRRLLVAASLEWRPGDGGLDEPRPLAAVGADTGGWRTVPSGRFVLGELPADDLLYFPTFPVAGPTVDPVTGPDPARVTISARAGDRAFVRSVEVDPLSADPDHGDDQPADPGPALRREVDDRQVAASTRASVAVGALSGVELRAVRVPLEATLPGVGPARRWLVEVVSINDWGEVSRAITGPVDLDLAGPAIIVSPPLLTLPWPLQATIEGVTESRALVSIDGGPPVEASRGGRFRAPTTLLPWPQTVELRAVDAEGNVTVRPLEVVGGFDYRQVPPAAWLVLAVFAIVIVSVVRDQRGREWLTAPPRSIARPSSGPGRQPLGTDDPPLPTIEDLPGPEA